jgi:hypothetical protein
MDEGVDCNVRAVSRALVDKAKRWWGFSLFLKVLLVVAGAAATFELLCAGVATALVIGLTIVSYLFQLRSAVWNRRADGLKRKLDFADSYGWNLPKAEWSDILLTLKQSHRDKLTTAPREAYFASTKTPGAQRALENLQESAWFSKYLARIAGHISLAVILLLIGLSITTLVVSLYNLKDSEQLINISRVVIPVLMLVISCDVITLMLKYYSFSSQAGLIEKAVDELLKIRRNDIVPSLKTEQNDIVPSLKLWQDYHVSRATGPMIPTWLWSLKRNDLNSVWEKHRK